MTFYLSKFCYISFQKANNKIADRTAQMRRLISAFVVRIQENRDSLASRHIQLLFTISGINISEKKAFVSIFLLANIKKKFDFNIRVANILMLQVAFLENLRVAMRFCFVHKYLRSGLVKSVQQNGFPRLACLSGPEFKVNYSY